MLNFNIKSGFLEFTEYGLKGATFYFIFNHFEISSTELVWHIEDKQYISENKTTGVIFQLKIENKNILKLKIINNTRKELFLKNIKIVFPPSLNSSEFIEYLHTRSFDKICGTRKVGLANRWHQGDIASSMVYCISGFYDDKAMLIGATPPHAGDFITIKACHETSHLEGDFGIAINSQQARLIPPGKIAKCSPLIFKIGNNAISLLEAYGDVWRAKRTRPLKPRCQGWNSWDYYTGTVTAEDCFKNMHECRKNFGKAIKYIVIDEGWEPRWGKWIPNWKFPKGIENFCSKVKKEGCKPGIWTAPLLVNAYTDIYRQNPEWFGRDSKGNIITKLYSYGPMAFLDPTHPDAAVFLRDTFTRLRCAGMEYFKVDFTQEILQCDCFHDMTIGRGGIIRRAFEIIREAIGDDAYLLSCGAPFESVTDIADCVRTTADIHNLWSHVLVNGGVMASRWWMSGKLFNVDPDYLIMRTTETSSDQYLNSKYKVIPFDGKNWWMAGREFNLQEAKLYALSIYMSGGDIFLGDAIDKLNNTGIDLLKHIFDAPVITRSAIPIDLFSSHSEQSTILVAHEQWGSAVCLFNWNDDIKLISIVPEKLNIDFSQAHDFWTQQDEGKYEKYDFKLMPRSAKCILFKK